MSLEEFQNNNTVFDRVMKEYADAPFSDLTYLLRASVILMCRSAHVEQWYGTDAAAFKLYESLKREINTDIYMELGPKNGTVSGLTEAVLDRRGNGIL